MSKGRGSSVDLSADHSGQSSWGGGPGLCCCDVRQDRQSRAAWTWQRHQTRAREVSAQVLGSWSQGRARQKKAEDGTKAGWEVYSWAPHSGRTIACHLPALPLATLPCVTQGAQGLGGFPAPAGWTLLSLSPSPASPPTLAGCKSSSVSHFLYCFSLVSRRQLSAQSGCIKAHQTDSLHCWSESRPGHRTVLAAPESANF